MIFFLKLIVFRFRSVLWPTLSLSALVSLPASWWLRPMLTWWSLPWVSPAHSGCMEASAPWAVSSQQCSSPRRGTSPWRRSRTTSAEGAGWSRSPGQGRLRTGHRCSWWSETFIASVWWWRKLSLWLWSFLYVTFSMHYCRHHDLLFTNHKYTFIPSNENSASVSCKILLWREVNICRQTQETINTLHVVHYVSLMAKREAHYAYMQSYVQI